jgi:hypothetical protein
MPGVEAAVKLLNFEFVKACLLEGEYLGIATYGSECSGFAGLRHPQNCSVVVRDDLAVKPTAFSKKCR